MCRRKQFSSFVRENEAANLGSETEQDYFRDVQLGSYFLGCTRKNSGSDNSSSFFVVTLGTNKS